MNNALTKTYDLAGNRLSEQVSQKTLLAGTDAQTDVLYQDNHLAYDALNRLRVVYNDQANVSIHYDRVGNRSRIETDLFLLPGGSAPAWAAPSQKQTFTYDAMNRQTSFTTAATINTPADQVAGQATTTSYSYDLVGNRVYEALAGHGDAFTFDDLNRVVAVQRNGGPIVETRQYDGGRAHGGQPVLPGRHGGL